MKEQFDMYRPRNRRHEIKVVTFVKHVEDAAERLSEKITDETEMFKNSRW